MYLYNIVDFHLIQVNCVEMTHNKMIDLNIEKKQNYHCAYFAFIMEIVAVQFSNY